MEDDLNVSLRDKITREMLTNMLIHREFTSPYIAKFIIEEDRMYTENACRASRTGEITPDNLSPVPKNPIIASFFNQIGNADELGSGTRNLYKYSRRYSGKNPIISEGDIFKTIVPLNDQYSFDAEQLSETGFQMTNKVGEKVGEKVGDFLFRNLTENQRLIIGYLEKNPQMSAVQLAEKIGISARKTESNIRKLKQYGILQRKGSPKNGFWVVQTEDSLQKQNLILNEPE